MPSFIGNNATRKGEENMKKTTDFLFTVTMLLAITLVIAIMPTEKEAAIYDNTVRLHILANSDSEDDQGLKLRIRDRLLSEYGTHLATSASSLDAEERISDMLPKIEASISEWISEYGYDYSCSVALGTEWYDTREYNGFTLPKGYYTSLQVMLGEAEGQNWWCVMYPPLCLDIATEDAPRDDAIVGYTKEEYALITEDGYNVKFKILELFSDAFS